MSRWYKRHLGPKLTQVVQEATSVEPDEQLAVFEEIALMRDSAGVFVAIHSQLVEQNAPQEALAASALAMQSALGSVVETCTKAVKAHEKQKKFSAHDISFVVDQIVSIMWEFLGDKHKDLADQIIDALRERIVLPEVNTGTQPVDTKPSDTVSDIDNSIPYVEDEDSDDEES